MNKLLLTSLFTFLSLVAFAQMKFEPGYFIDNEGNRTDCLIRNYDKISNKTQFEYKLSDDSSVMLATIEKVQEFEILNTVHKYQRFIVNIDQSANATKELTYSREPEFKQEQLFLRVLVEGNASLYEYNGHKGLQRYFYKKDTAAVEQLIFKEYLITETRVGENNSYKQQLLHVLNCPSFTFVQVNNTNYREKDLVKIFEDYNTCIGSPFTNYTKRREKGELAFTVKGGISFLNVDVTHLRVYRNNSADPGTRLPHKRYKSFGPDVSPQIGLEIEYIFPVNNKRWSVFLEPTLQYFKQSEKIEGYIYSPSVDPSERNEEEVNLNLEFTQIVLPVGFKHYIPFNDRSKLYLNAGFVTTLLLNPSESVIIEGVAGKTGKSEESINMNLGFKLGVGYKFKDKLNIEVYHQPGSQVDVTPKEPVSDFHPEIVQASFRNQLTVMVGYRLF
jgi:hypothetical protein